MSTDLTNTSVTTNSSVASPIAGLFPELLDAVFEWVYAGDLCKGAIFACSLVSSRWELLSRRQRFRKVWFCISEELVDATDVRLWAAFIVSPAFTRMAPWIRQLVLKFGIHGDKRMHSGFLQVLPLLPQLHDLELHGIVRKRILPHPDHIPVDSLQKITRLAIVEVWVSHPDHGDYDPRTICDLLSLFPSTMELKIVEFSHSGIGFQPTYDWTRWSLPRPEVLVLDRAELGALLHTTCLSARVEAVKWDVDSEREYNDPGLLEVVAPTLKFLDIVVRTSPHDLRHNSALRSITLRGHKHGTRQWEQVAAILCSLPHDSSLRSLYFSIRIGDRGCADVLFSVQLCLNAPSVDAIEATLVRLATKGELQDVVFEVERGHAEYFSAPKFFARLFPALAELGVLKSSHHDLTSHIQPIVPSTASYMMLD